MFINENTANMHFYEATAKPDYMFEAILEANDAYHDLCMKMIKCEHVAIINENTEMLAEAEGSFKERVKKIADTLFAKFIAFIDRVKAEWTKLWSSMLSKLVDAENVSEMLDLISKKNIAVEANFKGIVKAGELFEKVRAFKGTNIEMQLSSIRSILDSEKDQKASKKVTTQDVKIAVTFLKERPKWIKQLEDMKKAAKNTYKIDISRSEGKADNLLLAQYSSVVSKVISRINSFTSDAVRICKAAKKMEKANENYKAAQQNMKDTAANNDSKMTKQYQSGKSAFGNLESVLDLFA